PGDGRGAGDDRRLRGGQGVAGDRRIDGGLDHRVAGNPGRLQLADDSAGHRLHGGRTGSGAGDERGDGGGSGGLALVDQGGDLGAHRGDRGWRTAWEYEGIRAVQADVPEDAGGEDLERLHGPRCAELALADGLIEIGDQLRNGQRAGRDRKVRRGKVLRLAEHLRRLDEEA